MFIQTCSIHQVSLSVLGDWSIVIANHTPHIFCEYERLLKCNVIYTENAKNDIIPGVLLTRH